ncbi:MAG: HlyD family efflux transporter periplasmic adaptor subunit [Tolypothrix sp. Co-bin9]|nr:HlyD family efflux transporter periplasmic adaptor subunit [Tolypothrix sp. Co-bin9]
MFHAENRKLLPGIGSQEFLPPISPWTSLTGIFLVGTVCSAIALSSWVKYNVIVKAAGTVRPTGDVRLVQSDMEGTVKNIFVKENQHVKKDDAIAILDDEQLSIKKSQLQGNIQQGMLQLIQINAQMRTLDTQIKAESTVIERSVSAATADLERNQREYQERTSTTNNELLAAQADLEKANLDLQKAKADLDFAAVDRDRYEELSQNGAIGKREFEQKKLIVIQTKSILETQKKSIEIAKAKVASAKVALNPSKAAVAIALGKIAQEKARGESTIATLNKEKQALIQRQVEMQNQINQSNKELQQLKSLFKNSTIRATSDGIILKLNLRNPGQVVAKSESIAEIVPDNAPLLIKAAIPTTEIKKVAIGQKVQLRVDACPYPDYGTLKGAVKAISPDVIAPQTNNTGAATATAASYFEVTIKPESRSFGNSDRQCLIQAGMDAKADIISKEETALQFIMRRTRLTTDL